MNRFIAIMIFLSIAGEASCEIILDVVYPRFGDDGALPVIDQVDSSFVFGSVDPPDCIVIVNGLEAKVYPNGAFMAFVQLDYESMSYRVYARSHNDETMKVVPFTFHQPVPADMPNVNLPVTLEVIHPHSVIRYSEDYGVYYMFPQEGARCFADKIDNNFFGIRLNEAERVWIEDRFVELRPDLPLPSVSRVYSLKINDFDSEIQLLIPVANRPLHRIVELTDPPRLRVILYGLESHIDVIRNRTSYIREVRWEQLNPETLALTLYLDSPRIWGYSAEIDSSGYFIFKVRKPPRTSLEHLRIAIDPGHGGQDFGAIGPTRLNEKEINLIIAEKLARILNRKGTAVFLTRTTDEFVELYDRMDKAYKWGADLFISIHNNAVSDGVNPFERRGVGVYYYHPNSLELARAVHKRLLDKTELPDDGLYYGNLAVPRTTTMPSILVEAAYIIHPEDEMLLRNEKFQKRIAIAIYKGIKDFIKTTQREADNW